jgi:hypothetical protein
MLKVLKKCKKYCYARSCAMSPIALNEAGVDAATIEKEISQKIFCVKKVNQKQC